MKERLDQLTIAEFVDLLCGDTRVVDANPLANPEKVATAVRDIVLEYKEIADSASVRTYLSELESLVKAKMEMSIYCTCSAMIAFGKYDEARGVLDACGIHAKNMSDTWLDAEVKSRLARAKKTIEELQETEQTEERQTDVRKEFDSQAAALMAHFKFQIDMRTMKASLFAHLTARFRAEVKAQMEAMKKK